MISFEVLGRAQPAGSKRAFVVAGRARVTDANPNAKPWKALVAYAASEAYDGPLLEGPLVVVIRETRLRPKSHFGVKGLNAKGRASEAPTTRPDCLKIARGVEDALTGVLWHDDSQIVAEMLVKAWAGPGERERTQVVVRTFAEMDDEIYEAGMPALRLVCDDGTEVTR